MRFPTVALILFIVASGAAEPCLAGALSPRLGERLATAGPGEFIPIVVVMEEFPDQHELMLRVGDLNREQRRARVVSTMRDLAERSQGPIRAALSAESERVRGVRVLWGINGLAFEAPPAVIEWLPALPGVRWVLHDREIPWQEAIGVDLERVLAERPPWPGLTEGPIPEHDGQGDGPTGGDASGPNPNATVAGEVVAMGAQQVWDELGYAGNGVIVGVIDSGIDRNHPDLADHIWTNLDEIPDNGLDDDGNGYTDDTWGWDFCNDDNDPSSGSHGTQVAGQVAGDGTNGTVTGMAPDAELMALGISCGGPSVWWQASDYALANGAHLLTQSYSYRWISNPDYEAFRRQTDTELAAGVIHLNSSGNTGQTGDPVPYNVTAPANSPTPWLHPDQTLVGGLSSMVATANVNWGTDLIDVTSPYGPSAWEDIQANTNPDYPHTIPADYLDYPYENGQQQGLLKPDLAAYGEGTTTTCPGTGYCGFGGTSSSTPHIAGVVALMLSSNSEATPEQLTEALLTHAEPRGVPGKNNRYGAGLVQAYASVVAVESGVIYDSHSIDDVTGGNGNLVLDPGEQVTIPVTVRSTLDQTVSGLEVILSTTTSGVTIHDHHATFPDLSPGGTTTSSAPHFSLTADPATCGTAVVLDLELRYEGKVRRSVIRMRVGDEQAGDLLADDFESPGGWTSDPGTGSDGEWVREDPIGVLDGQGVLANPEDDTTDEPGVACWVTGNGEQTGRKDENNNDVDGGEVILLSPPFGEPAILALSLRYDRWYYDNSSGGDQFRVEVSNDGGTNWTQIELLINSTGGWAAYTANLLQLIEPSDDMRVRFIASDGLEDTPVEAAVDEVRVQAVWVDCQDHTPPAALPPNPVGDTLRVDGDPAGHTVLSWDAPPVDGSHDAATLYRVERANSPAGFFTEVGSATTTRWVDVDAVVSTDPFYYRVRAENPGGPE